MNDRALLDLVWTVCDALFRWTHVAGVAAWLGAVWALHFLRERSADPREASRALLHPLAPRALAFLRHGAGVTWVAGMLLLFSHYYHGLLGPVLLDGGLSFELEEALVKPSGEPTVRAWLPGFFALFAGWGLYELLFSFARGALALALASLVGAALWIGLGVALDEYFHYSARAAWTHLGAIGGTALAASLWIRVWPAQQRLLEQARSGQALDTPTFEFVRARLAQAAYIAPLVLMFMLANHYPLLFGGNPWPWPAVAGAVLALGTFVVAAVDRLARAAARGREG